MLRITASCTTPDGCGWTGGPYKTEVQARYALSRHSCDKHRRDTERHERAKTALAAIDRTPRTCHHKQANHQHGTHAAYRLDGCRCAPCGQATMAYDRARIRQTAYGRWQPYVPADRARQHVRDLMAAGVGLKRIGALTGVSSGTLWKLVYGQGGKPPSQRIRPTTEAKLLAVRADQHAAGARVPAIGTARRLQALACLGWSVQRLADHAGLDRQPLDHAITGGRDVTRRTRDAVTALYDDLWNTPPPAGDHRSKIAASRTRSRAAAAGWLPPLAWDDPDSDPTPQQECEDDPRIVRAFALVEDLAELAELGLTLDQACARLDISKDRASVTLRRHTSDEGRAVRDRYLRNATIRDLGRTA